MPTIYIQNIEGWYHVVYNGVVKPQGYRSKASAQAHAMMILDGWI